MTPHNRTPDLTCDIAIVGGGLVGASLALALAPTGGLSLAVIEAVAADDPGQPSFDQRSVALTHNARRIYAGMGVWDEIAARGAEPIREIHISDRGHFGMTHLHCNDAGVEALGYVVPSRSIGQVLYQRLRQSAAITLLCPATVEGLRQAPEDGVPNLPNLPNVLSLSQNGQPLTVQAGLVVVADGGRSNLAAQVGVEWHHHAYPQHAIVSIVHSDRAHRGRAWERFTGEGPLALLPWGDNRYALVWTTDAEQVAARMALPDDAFVGELQRAFGDRAGNFSRPSARNCYGLQRGHTESPVGRRAVIIGNAAHTVHPVAGQGFNLGLRDAAVLAEVLHRAHTRQRDLGGAGVLAEYADLRRRETRTVRGFTDGLIQLFCDRRWTTRLARNLALVGIELCPPAKRFLLRRTMGLAGTPSRLGAGLPLAGG